MATTRRDIELLISAKETTGRSFQQVVANIDTLNSKIAEQVKAAQSGEISLQELRQTQEALAQAGRDLSAIQGQIDSYTRLAATSDKVAAAADKAKADLAALKAEIAASGEATARQEQQMQRLENAVVRTSAAVDKNKADLAEQVAVLDRAGIATRDLDSAQAGVVNTARQIGAGLSQVNAAVSDYAANIAAAKQRETKAREDAAKAQRQETELARLEAAERKALADGEVRAQQEAAARRAALITEIAQAEKQLAQQQAFDTKISEAQRLGDASRFVKLFADSVNSVAVAENQLSALTGFRAVGQMALEASNDMTRFAQSGQLLAGSSSQVAAGLRAIIDPGQAALKTLDGVEAAIATADAASAEGVTNVGKLNEAYNDLAAASAALVQQGSLVDQFRDQAAATDAARTEFAAAQADVQRFALAMVQAEKPTEELANSLRQAEARLEQTGRALAIEDNRLDQLGQSLRRAGISTADLANEQARLEAAAQRVSVATDRINTSLGRGGRETNALFGLKPNDLANLNFQLQDIFVSLQAGQNPLTVLIQQGSQISQIFPGLISSVAKLVLRFFPLIAIAVAVGAAFFELAQDAERLKKAQEDLAAAPLGAGIDAERFADAQEKLEGVAKSADEARSAMLLLVEEGFDTDSIETYAEAAGRLAERLGIDVVEATQLLVDVQQGGIDAVLELAERTNDLTEADLDHAQALFEAGKAGEARQFVLDRVAERNAQIAKATQSEWTPAVKNLQSAFSNFADFLGRIFGPILDGIESRVNSAIVGFTFLTGLLAGKGIAGAQEDAFEVIRKQRGLTPAPARGASDQQIRDRRFRQELDDEVESSRELTKEERLRRVEVDARRRAQNAGVSKALEDRAVQQATAAEQRKINDENAKSSRSANASSRRAAAAQNRAARAQAAEDRKRESALRQLEGQLRQLNRAAFAGVSASLEERLTAIDEKYENIADSLERARGLGLTASEDGMSFEAIERQVEATKQRLKDEERIKFFQEQAALLDKQRVAELERISEAQARGAISTTEAMAQAEEVTRRLSPQIVTAAEKALAVARAIAGATPSPEMVSWIASLERIISGEAIDRAAADIGLAGFEAAGAELDTLIRERDELVRSYQALFELGLRTDAEVRDLTTEAYAQQAAAIEPVLTKLREQAALLNATIDPLTNLPVLTDIAYATWLARLDAVEAGLAQIDPRLQQVNAAASQAIQNGVAQAFNAVAQSIFGLISGTESFGDALGNLGRTALSVFGSILEAIAQVLIQMIALQIAQSILGVPAGGGGGGLLSFLFHDGGVVGSRGASRQRRTGGSNSWLGAPKFHGGGGMGLRPDEYKAVLQRGEEVLTEDDPRHIRNLGKGGGGDSGGSNIKQVLLLDPGAVPNAMQSRSGQKSILTVIRQNKDTIKQVLK
jgi:hypothetical protein